MQKSLSLIIPAYNEARHIKACLDAIAAQTEVPDEVIVVDNNSTDDTVAIASQYPFVRIVRETKQGRVFARDCGFNAAKGDIIGRIDADSMLPRHWVKYIKAFYAMPEHDQIAWTGGGYFYNLQPYAHIAGWVQGQIAYRINRLLMGHYILWGSNMAIPRNVWADVRRSVCHGKNMHEDLDLAIHLHRAGYVITYHEGVKVGVEVRRVFTDRKELWDNLLWWPKTLQLHGNKRWVFGWFGAKFLYYGSFVAPVLVALGQLPKDITLRRWLKKRYARVQYVED